MVERVRLLDVVDLERSLTSDHGPIDEGLAVWAIEIVSAAALAITRRQWADPLDVPPGVMAVLALAARRLYVNPDRMTREAEGDYSYGLDSSVTKADVFTPNEVAVLEDHRAVQRVQGLGTLSTYRGDTGVRRTGYVPDGSEYGFPWYGEDMI